MSVIERGSLGDGGDGAGGVVEGARHAVPGEGAEEKLRLPAEGSRSGCFLRGVARPGPTQGGSGELPGGEGPPGGGPGPNK